MEDKAGGEEGGKRKNRSGRQAKIDGGETSHTGFAEGDQSTDRQRNTLPKKVCGRDHADSKRPIAGQIHVKHSGNEERQLSGQL